MNTSTFCTFALMPLLLAAAQVSAETATVRPKATDEALINPDMGFVYYKYSNRLWAYGINTPENDTLDWFPGCSTVYMRVLWNDIEPEEGEYRWDLFDTAAQGCDAVPVRVFETHSGAGQLRHLGAGGWSEVPRHVRAAEARRVHARRLRRLMAGNARNRAPARRADRRDAAVRGREDSRQVRNGNLDDEASENFN